MNKARESGYMVKETKSGYKMTYSGDLEGALEKAKVDLIKKQSDPNMRYWQWLKDKAAKEIGANERAIERINAFISAAGRQLEKESEVPNNG